MNIKESFLIIGVITRVNSDYLKLYSQHRAIPKLPIITTEEHSIVQADPKTLFIIGGNIGRGGAPIGNPPPHLVFGNTWTIDLSNNGYKAERGPSLMTARFSHSCGKMELAGGEGIVLIVVAGGHDKDRKCLDSVELLQLSSTNALYYCNGWEKGM